MIAMLRKVFFHTSRRRRLLPCRRGVSSTNREDGFAVKAALHECSSVERDREERHAAEFRDVEYNLVPDDVHDHNIQA